MSEDFLITSDIMTNGRFVSVSLLARYLYMAMILLADQEGRAVADPRSWRAHATLWDAADAQIEDIAQAILELDASGLIVLYDDGSRFFLPGRFEHNRGRDWWKCSKHPLPPVDLLHKHPEYLNGLRCLTTKGRLYVQTSEPRRYPELWADSTLVPVLAAPGGELGGNRGEVGGNQGESTDNSGEVGIVVDVGVGVDQEKKSASRTIASIHVDEDQPPYAEIIGHLNDKLGTRYRPSATLARKHIHARWGEGYRLGDFRKVIDLKVNEWLGTDYAKYLRPETLFGPKFESYLNSAPLTHSPTGDAYQPFKEEEHDDESQ